MCVEYICFEMLILKIPKLLPTFNTHVAQLVDISGETGIVLDRVYTLKGVRGMLGEMRSNPSRFKGRRVMFLHTGWWHVQCTPCVQLSNTS